MGRGWLLLDHSSNHLLLLQFQQLLVPPVRRLGAFHHFRLSLFTAPLPAETSKTNGEQGESRVREALEEILCRIPAVKASRVSAPT